MAGQEGATLTLADLGLRSDAAEKVARARSDADGMGVARRVWHRLLNKPVGRSYDVRASRWRGRRWSARSPPWPSG